MQIELYDVNGCAYRITSSDPQIIAAWFAEMLPDIMSVDTRYNHPLTIDVWPITHDELNILKGRRRCVGKPGWLDLIDYMGKLADAMPEE